MLTFILEYSIVEECQKQNCKQTNFKRTGEKICHIIRHNRFLNDIFEVESGERKYKNEKTSREYKQINWLYTTM